MFGKFFRDIRDSPPWFSSPVNLFIPFLDPKTMEKVSLPDLDGSGRLYSTFPRNALV